MNTRETIFVSVVVLLLVLFGAWWYFGFSLDFMRFFAAEPGVTDTTGTTTTTTPAPDTNRAIPTGCTTQNGSVVCQTVSCSAPSSAVTVGTVVTIQAYGGSGGYAFTAPGGVVDTANTTGAANSTDSVGVRYDTPGTKQVLVTATRASDPTQTDVATCRITVVPAAVTN